MAQANTNRTAAAPAAAAGQTGQYLTFALGAETFAIGIMPASASTYNVNIVQANPMVRAVCSDAVLLRSRAGRARLIPPSRWQLQVLTPDEAAYDSGVRTYRCLASLGYGVSRTSQFGP